MNKRHKETTYLLEVEEGWGTRERVGEQGGVGDQEAA